MMFPMTLDRVNRGSTIVVGALVAVCGVALLVAPEEARGAGALIYIGVILVLGIAWALAPKAIEVDHNEIRIHRRMAPPLRFSTTEIVSVESGPRPSMGTSLRLFGTGGFFGSFGLFWTRGFGRYRLFATRTGPTIALRRAKGLPLVVTPDDPERVRQALTRSL